MCLELSIAPALTQSEALCQEAQTVWGFRDAEFQTGRGVSWDSLCLSTELTSVSAAVTTQSIQCG